MSGSEMGLIFGGMGLIIILPIVAIAAVYFVGRQNKDKFQRVIEMDGAKCLQAKDGSVAIKTNTWINILVVIFLLVTLGACGSIAVDNLSRGTSTVIEQGLMVGLWAIITVPMIIYLVRALRRPGFYFNREGQVLEIKRATAKRQIPFGQMAKLSVDTWKMDIGWLNLLSIGFYFRQDIPCVCIKLVLEKGEVIELGRLSSGVKGQEDFEERCRDVCQLIADAAGVKLPSEMPAGNV